MSSATIEWVRRPAMYSKADYDLFVVGEHVARVAWCGHPTALYPYYIQGVTFDAPIETFRTVREAKARAEELATAVTS